LQPYFPSIGAVMTMPRQTSRLILVCTGLLLAAGPLRAAETPPAAPASTGAAAGRVMDLSYEVYLGGLHIFSLNVDMALRPGSYSVAAAGGTRGMIGWIYKWDIKLAAEGADSVGAIRPKSYASETDWQSTPKTMKLSFGEGGSYDVQRKPPEEIDVADEGELPATLPANAVDPLSLAVAATRALAASGKCAQTLPVFDGKRRYDLIVKDLGEATIAKNSYSIYQGPALRCGFTMERISGFSKKRRYARQWDEESSAAPTVFMAQIRPDMPPVPVRYEGAIALGNMVIHLTKAEVRSELAENTPR
jgi:hypothetical protein